MKHFPPLSLFRMIALAMTVVLVPPFVALFTATIEVGQLAATGERTVLLAVATADQSHAMVDHLTAMERFARQRHILGDESLGTRYLGRRAELLASMEALEGLPLSPALHAQLDTVQSSEASLFRALEVPAHSEAYGTALESFGPLSEAVRALRSAAADEMGLAAGRLEDDAEGLQQKLARQGLWVLPLMLAALGLVWYGAVRPTRALDLAIRQLGAGRLDHQVQQVHGPLDLQGLGQRLEWLRTQLLAVESDRVRLFHHVSHELKTPLTCIREGAQLLSEGVPGPVTTEQVEILDILVANADRLHQQIEDLLRISELRTQQTKLDLALVDVRDVIEQVVAQNTVTARARNIDFEIDTPRLQVHADAIKLRTVVGNLVSNALKHGPPGRPVRIVARRTAEGIEVTVADEGPGIPAQERESVFQAFQQGQTAWISAKRGTGLGLTIAREYMRAHGGDVVIADRPVGTLVVASLPEGMA